MDTEVDANERQYHIGSLTQVSVADFEPLFEDNS